jgi:predicted glycosyltransferase
VIRDALETFEPDVLIADHLPRGALRELEPALESLRARGDTRCVLGLRDVLDDPETVHREWFRANNENAIRRYYDAVWVYGDPAVYDLVREYHFPPDLAAKVRYTGYLTPPIQTAFAQIDGAELLTAVAGPPDRLVLCMLGGGQDGAFLAEAFAQVDFPPGTKGVILTGPFMPPEVRHCLYRRAAANPQLRVVKFVTDPDILLGLADRVVTMGGYNTTYEVLVAEKPALIVPRTGPRREQLIRAERLRQLGLVDVLPQDRLSSAALMEWLGRDPGPRPRVLGRIDFQGAERLPHLLAEVLNRPPCRPGAQPREERLKHVRH